MKGTVAPSAPSRSTALAPGNGISGWRALNQVSKVVEAAARGPGEVDEVGEVAGPGIGVTGPAVWSFSGAA
jgi:hypothetical protein